MVVRIRDLLSERFAVERFLVVYHPWNSGLEAMSRRLDDRDVEYASLIDLFDKTDVRFVHSLHNNHLNPAGNEHVAREILRLLQTGR